MCTINIAQASIHTWPDLSPSLYFVLPLEFSDILFWKVKSMNEYEVLLCNIVQAEGLGSFYWSAMWPMKGGWLVCGWFFFPLNVFARLAYFMFMFDSFISLRCLQISLIVQNSVKWFSQCTETVIFIHPECPVWNRLSLKKIDMQLGYEDKQNFMKRIFLTHIMMHLKIV